MKTMNQAVNRIITVTPNPAIDMTYTVAGITEGASHRVATPLSRAGGKGLNVARVTHQLGYPVLAIAPTGGAAGPTSPPNSGPAAYPTAWWELPRRRGAASPWWTPWAAKRPSSTRRGSPPDLEWRSLRRRRRSRQRQPEPPAVLVGSGSLPPGAPADFYPELVRLAHDAGIPAIIDTSGPGIIAAAQAGADILKPNHHELAEATGETSLDGSRMTLDRHGARTVLVSAGADGMLAFDHAAPGGYWSARLPEALSGNPTGAGDAGVAAAAVALAEGITDTPRILRRATAWSAAAVLMPAAGEISPRYQELQDQLIVTWKETR